MTQEAFATLFFFGRYDVSISCDYNRIIIPNFRENRGGDFKMVGKEI